MTDPLIRSHLTIEPNSPEEDAWLEGFNAGRASIMTAWKFLPLGGTDQYGNVVYATSDQIDKDLMEILGHKIAKQIVKVIQR